MVQLRGCGHFVEGWVGGWWSDFVMDNSVNGFIVWLAE